uniref:Ribosomal protein S10 n=1 Tax=Oncorhynchus mykiss TaxID=8022 RepID=A0A8C7UC06_ONCMY
MLMPKKNCIAIYELLFKEGHPELADNNVPNIHVVKAMQSTGYVKEQFGIQYLRDFLHLPPEIVPATLRRQMRPETARPRPKGMEGERAERPAKFNLNTFPRMGAMRYCSPIEIFKDRKHTNFVLQRGGFGRGRGQQPPQE